MNIKRSLIKLVAKKPNSFKWTVKDFETAKFWAKGQPHPYSKNMTLWDYVNNNWSDSVEILNNIKIYIETNGTIK